MIKSEYEVIIAWICREIENNWFSIEKSFYINYTALQLVRNGPIIIIVEDGKWCWTKLKTKITVYSWIFLSLKLYKSSWALINDWLK
jgi:hypothetical protein